eukprot:189233-Pelagomonas_calceolata.AAC.9
MKYADEDINPQADTQPRNAQIRTQASESKQENYKHASMSQDWGTSVRPFPELMIRTQMGVKSNAHNRKVKRSIALAVGHQLQEMEISLGQLVNKRLELGRRKA